MEYSERLSALVKLKGKKERKYIAALALYDKEGQNAITFDEICQLNQEIKEIDTLIMAVKNIYHL